jgi:hypothetical protein
MNQQLLVVMASFILFTTACNDHTKANAIKQKNGEATTSKDSVKPNAILPIVNNANATSNNYLIGTNNMGLVQMGMAKAEILKLYPNAKEDSINLEIMVNALSITDSDGKKLFYATYDLDGKVDGFYTENPKMATKDKVHVGSNYEFLKKSYSDLKLEHIGGVVAISEKANITFAMEGNITFKIKDNEITNEVEKADPNAIVTHIFIH